MIDFELSQRITNVRQMIHAVAEQMMRPISREYDEREHEKPWDFLNTMWSFAGNSPMGGDRALGSKHRLGWHRRSEQPPELELW